MTTRKSSPYYLLSVLIFLGVFGTTDLNAAQSVIKAILQANQSTVSILAESGAIAPVAAKPFIVKETGEILIATAYRGIKYNQTGSGVIIHSSGLIAANHHVVDQAGRITVTLPNQKSYEAEIVLTAPENDIAILRIQTPDELTSVELANSDTVSLNDKAYLIGNSELIKNTLTEGRVTGLAESKSTPEDIKPHYSIIEVNFELHKGDSGSPVLNQYGECMGIITAGRDKQNITYAIPSNTIKRNLHRYLSEHPENNG